MYWVINRANGYLLIGSGTGSGLSSTFLSRNSFNGREPSLRGKNSRDHPATEESRYMVVKRRRNEAGEDRGGETAEVESLPQGVAMG